MKKNRFLFKLQKQVIKVGQGRQDKTNSNSNIYLPLLSLSSVTHSLHSLSHSFFNDSRKSARSFACDPTQPCPRVSKLPQYKALLHDVERKDYAVAHH